MKELSEIYYRKHGAIGFVKIPSICTKNMLQRYMVCFTDLFTCIVQMRIPHVKHYKCLSLYLKTTSRDISNLFCICYQMVKCFVPCSFLSYHLNSVSLIIGILSVDDFFFLLSLLDMQNRTLEKGFIEVALSQEFTDTSILLNSPCQQTLRDVIILNQFFKKLTLVILFQTANWFRPQYLTSQYI